MTYEDIDAAREPGRASAAGLAQTTRNPYGFLALRIAVNTTCAVTGGAITHLRHLLPAMEPFVGGDEVIVIGDAAMRKRLAPPPFVRWSEIAPSRAGLAGRILQENGEIPRRLRALSVDVLFHPSNFCVFRTRVPQVILIHNIAPFLPELIEEESLHQKIRLRILRWLTRASVDRASGVIFISEWGRRLVTAGWSLRDCPMPVISFGAQHGSDVEDFAPGAAWSLAPDEYVLTVSHLYRYKKLENLIGAWTELGERVASWPLLIVGAPFDRGYSARLERMARSARSRIVFAGSLDEASLVRLMEGCRAFVFTSEAENLPITLLEAMAAGCAIVTNPKCSMPETCDDAVLYADPPTPESYRHQLERILWNDSLRSEMRRRSRKQASRFRWENAARETLALLREVCAANRSRV